MEKPPPVLRTGLIDDGAKIDKTSALGKRLISTVFVLVDRAAKTAALYCTHAKRSQVTVDDVQLALKYHAMTFLAEEGFEELEKDVASMEGLVDEFVNEQVTSEEVIDDMCDDDRSSEESEEEEDSEFDCPCKICTGVRSTDWNTWDPTDPAEQFIKKHVDEIMTM